MKQIEILLEQIKKIPARYNLQGFLCNTLINSDYFVVSTNIATRLKSFSSEISLVAPKP